MKYWYFLFSAITAFIVYQFLNGGTSTGKIVTSIILGLIGGLCVFAFAEIKRRKENGINLFATLETDPEKVKAAMLYRMQWGGEGGTKETLNQFNDIFRNYPQWELHNWEVFRAWYKDQIDCLIQYPEIITLTMKDGSPYDKDKDPLYDPDAPDWELFDRPHDDSEYFYDEDDEEDDDDNDDFSDNKKDSASDWIYRGIGFGLVNSIFSGNGNSGGGSN